MAQTTVKMRQIAGGLDGWIPAEETWAYASATTITVPSGAASKYQKGDKIKITNNSATKYFSVVGVADTVLTVTGGTDYTVHDSAITNPFFSKIENPQGFPRWFNYSPTWSGASSMTYSSISTPVERFYITGSVCHVSLSNNGGTTGGTASNAITATLPLTPDTKTYNGAQVRDGTTTGFVPGWVEFSTDGKVYFYLNTTTNWGLGTGRHAKCQGFYFY